MWLAPQLVVYTGIILQSEVAADQNPYPSGVDDVACVVK